MKRVLFDIEVEFVAARPQLLRYRHRERKVQAVLDAWRYGGRWWRGESGRDYYLLELGGALTAEVYREDGGGRWVLSRISD